MRDYGTVSSRFWNRGSGKALRGNPRGQVLALYLMTCGDSSMIGIYPIGLPTICHETGLTEPEIREAFAHLATLDIAHYDVAEELVYLPNLAKHQLGASLSSGDKKIHSVVAKVRALDNHRFAVDFVRRYRSAYHLGRFSDLPDGASMGHQSPIEGASSESQITDDPSMIDAPSMGHPNSCGTIPKITDHRSQITEPSHTQGARAAVPDGNLSAETTAILAALRSHAILAPVATAILAGQIEGRRMGKGSLVAWVVTAIDDAARDAGAESASGSPPSASALAKLVVRYCDRARAPIAATPRGQGGAKVTAVQPRSPNADKWPSLDLLAGVDATAPDFDPFDLLPEGYPKK